MGRVVCQEGHPRHKIPMHHAEQQRNGPQSLAALWWAEGAKNLQVGSRAHDSGVCGVLKVCTVNVGSLKGRSREVVEMLSSRGVDICCLQEVRELHLLAQMRKSTSCGIVEGRGERMGWHIYQI